MHAVSVNAGAPAGAGDLPRTFGRYTLFDLIGKGGMAQIYLARAETELGATRLAVVKQILPAFADDPRFSDMLIHEAKLAGRLSHRHIVQVLDLGRGGEHDEHLYIAMEYVEGFDLNALLRMCTENSVPLPAEHALGIVADVLEGLDYAHRRADDHGVPLGIVHRDVSPSNVLISYDGEVKLCDFGIAHANDLVREGANEALKGKAGYMSPEHARGEDLDARSDVFAAGIILWELLAGKRLYRPRSETPLLDQARAAKIPTLPDKGLPDHEKLEAIVKKALAKDRNDRYGTSGAFLRDLDAYIATHGLLASRLKLGEWIASTFGTKLIEDRRASERRLPKSTPPPRSSERVRTSIENAAPASDVVPTASSIPRDLAPPTHSDGAMRAFKRELDESPVTSLPGLPHELAPQAPESLVGTAMDLLDEGRASMPVSSSRPLAKRRLTSSTLALYVAIGLAAGLGLVALARLLVH
jgi:serine/threonine-protein kinase